MRRLKLSMQSQLIQQIYTKAKEKKAKVVLPEGNDPRILEAARRIQDKQLAHPIVLGNTDAINKLAKDNNISLADIEIIDPETSSKVNAYAQSYIVRRSKNTIESAERIIKKPLSYGGMMVHSGDSDAMVAGAASSTAKVIKAALTTIGVAEGIKVASSYFLMQIPDFQGQKDKALIFADCGVNIDPNPEQLADIAISSAQNAEKLLGEAAKVAMLSFSTHGSAQHPLIDKVTEATAILKEKAPDLAVAGELQADAALIPSVAAKKVTDASGVAGQANVLIFPDINAGNICYKMVQYTANAQAVGPILQGFAKPVSDLSRGASVDDIITATAIILATA